jgi:hypothetical protein
MGLLSKLLGRSSATPEWASFFGQDAMRLPWCAMPIRQLAKFSRVVLVSPHSLIAPVRYCDKPDLVPGMAESTQAWIGRI